MKPIFRQLPIAHADSAAENRQIRVIDLRPCGLGFIFQVARLGLAILLLSILSHQSCFAYPPAPPHVVYGLVRNEMGDPIVVTNAQVILETLAGVQITTMAVPNLSPGMNYRIFVPMDAGLTSDAYKPTALRPLAPFRLKVKIGNVVYLPLEMIANYSALGKPAQSTRLDLTLGQDSNGDGLPDAWQNAVRTALGGNLALNDITPNGDADGDGLSNLDEYLAGTYAFDPQDGFRLSIVGVNGNSAQLEFLAIRGRSYTLLASTDLTTWMPVQFSIPAEGDSAPIRDCYQAKEVRILRIEANAEGPAVSSLFFKAEVQ